MTGRKRYTAHAIENDALHMEIFGMDFGCALDSLRNGEFPAKTCLLPLISKLLGYTLVAASTSVKLPQIMKILKHRSVRGLSAVSFELEVIGYTIGLSYCLHKGLPFSAFGEYVFLLTQAIILVSIAYYFSQPVKKATWIRALLYCAIAPTVLAGKIDPMLFEALYACQHAIFLSARVPQIIKNFKNKNTGELSFLTCLMNFGGSMGKCRQHSQFEDIYQSLGERPYKPAKGIRARYDNYVPKASCKQTEERRVER
ncbi:hypothetical protein V2J09_023841 [Rumex salicifolius]